MRNDKFAELKPNSLKNTPQMKNPPLVYRGGLYNLRWCRYAAVLPDVSTSEFLKTRTAAIEEMIDVFRRRRARRARRPVLCRRQSRDRLVQLGRMPLWQH